MSITKSHLKINHDILKELFYIKVKGGTAELRYRRQGDDYLEMYSTNVPEESREFGIASQLVEEALAYASSQKLKVKPTCPFVESYIRKHSEHHHFLS